MEQTEEIFKTPSGENDWPLGSKTFTRQEVFSLLWTQRAMIGNDLKAYCGKDLTQEIYAILDNPRTPVF